MSSKLTQATVAKLRGAHPSGTQIYDEEVPGLRVVIGATSASYKLVGRINDGSDRYVSIIVGRTDELSLKTARDKARELRLALRRGEDPRVKKRTAPTLQEAWERYRETRCKELRPLTVAWYTKKIEHALKPLLKVPLDRIDRETIRSLHEKITQRGMPFAANGAMRALKTLYNDAARSHDLPPNPVKSVRLNKEKVRDWAISPDDLPLMWSRLDAMEDRLRAACWLTMLTTGLRKNDAITMAWQHLDADGVLLVPSPKGGPDRSFRVPLPRQLLQELERVRQETAPLGSPFVFPSPGSRLGHFQEMRRTPAFPYAPHMMRHTYRTFALEAGVDFQTVTLLMNHRPAGVSWGYVTRAHLLGHMRVQQEKICEAIARHR